jgi:hypothetical protein
VVLVLTVLDEEALFTLDENIAGTEIDAIAQTFPPSEGAKPVYIVPPDRLSVDP